MSAPRLVEPLDGPVDAVVRVPGSKSLTNRALVCAALAEGESELSGALFADDTEAMLEAISRLGATVHAERDAARVTVTGTGGRLAPGPVEVDARLSGTTARFLLPVLALGPGPYRLDGAAPLRARPMADGIAAARDLGATVIEEGEDGHLPVRIEAAGARVGVVSLGGDVSSQFLSGVLLAGACSGGDLVVTVAGPLVSRPYVTMTTAVMVAFGATVDAAPRPHAWVVRGGGYQGAAYAIEPDASAASYFFAAAALTGGRVRIEGLSRHSSQGDLGFVEVLARMGADVRWEPDAVEVRGTGTLRGIDVDLGELSDTAQTLAVTAVFADGPTEVRGVGFIRRKETDRIAAVVTELGRCGIRAEATADGFVVHPGVPHAAVVRTYDDHRMAMSFALLGLRVPGIEIGDPECVAKTFPTYFDVLDELRAP